MYDTPLVFIDIETTGLSPLRDRIIEIGAIRVEKNRIVKKFKTLINPERHVPDEIGSLTGITGDMLEHAPEFQSVSEELKELFTGAVFVAHNARFDYGFIRAEFARTGHTFTAKQVCTAKLSRKLYPQFRRHNLDEIISRFNISIKNRHRAYDDAFVLWKFLLKVQKQLGKSRLDSAIDEMIKIASVPPHLSAALIQNLPERPGVYIFYGKNRAPLYVGKSVNIRERVKSHFSADYRNSKEYRLSQLVEDIECQPTAGELTALLTESQYIKEVQPLYNRLLRKAQEMIYITKESDKNGYDTVSLREGHVNSIDEINTILGIFRSKKQMTDAIRQLAKTYSLCTKLLGIDHTKGPCFNQQLGTCLGACIGKEMPARYNMRFAMAFSKLRIRQWPFQTPIVIEEYDHIYALRSKILAHHWCIGGYWHMHADSDEIFTDIAPHFDVDTYKILASYLLKKGSHVKITPLHADSSLAGQFALPV